MYLKIQVSLLSSKTDVFLNKNHFLFLSLTYSNFKAGYAVNEHDQKNSLQTLRKSRTAIKDGECNV